MPTPTPIVISGGPFADSEGNPVSNGYLVLSPSKDTAITGAHSQICGGLSIRLNLDNLGKVAANQSVWGTDNMTPTNAVYYVRLFKADGTLVWNKPQSQTITGSSFNVSSWVPN